MKKSSQLFESITVGLLNLSDQEFNQYKNFIKSSLDKIYPNKVNIENLTFVGPQKFDYPGRYKSIINYANTNMTLLKSIVDKFSIESTQELFNFLNQNYKEILSPEGQYFQNTLDILKRTEDYGNQNEILAAQFMQNVIKEKTGQNVEVKRTNTDSKEDLIDGVDVYFILDGKKYICQVKPLKEMSFNNQNYTIVSSGRIKPYKVDYWIFVDRNRQKFAAFKNRNASISNYTLTFDKNSFVSSN